MSREYALILISFILVVLKTANAQDYSGNGFLLLPDSSKWQIVFSDTVKYNEHNGIIALKPGSYPIIINPVNVKDWQVVSLSQTIKITSGDTLILSPGEIPLNTNLILSYKPQPGMTISDPFILPAREKRTNRYLRPALIFTAVSSNWVAFYFKRQADDYYSAYTKTSDLSKIKNNYNRASQFDAYSAVMLGVSAGALLTYMYILLND